MFECITVNIFHTSRRNKIQNPIIIALAIVQCVKNGKHQHYMQLLKCTPLSSITTTHESESIAAWRMGLFMWQKKIENIKTLQSEWKWQNNWTLVDGLNGKGHDIVLICDPQQIMNEYMTCVNCLGSSCCRNMIWRADLICREFGFVCRTEDFESSMGFSITAGETFERRVVRGILITEAALSGVRNIQNTSQENVKLLLLCCTSSTLIIYLCFDLILIIYNKKINN